MYRVKCRENVRTLHRHKRICPCPSKRCSMLVQGQRNREISGFWNAMCRCYNR
jgi:hypothetical protein